MIRSIQFLLVLLISFQVCYSSKGPEKVIKAEVTYIANEGFLIKSGDKTILIDAIFGDQEYGFCDIPDEVQIEAMCKAKYEYSNIDLIAATHSHIDHFYAENP